MFSITRSHREGDQKSWETRPKKRQDADAEASCAMQRAWAFPTVLGTPKIWGRGYSSMHSTLS